MLETLLDSEWLTIALPVLYSRLTIQARDAEPLDERGLHAVLLSLGAIQVFRRVDDWRAVVLVLAAQGASYLFSAGAFRGRCPSPVPRWLLCASSSGALGVAVCALGAFELLILFACGVGAIACAALGSSTRGFVAGAAVAVGIGVALPPIATRLLPYAEVVDAWASVMTFAGSEARALNTQVAIVAHVTLHMQIALGHLGIAYIRTSQDRANLLWRVAKPTAAENESSEPSAASSTPAAPAAAVQGPSLTAPAYARSVVKFMFFVAAPYLLQVVRDDMSHNGRVS